MKSEVIKEREERLEKANQLIHVIASHGRHFFCHRGVTSWLELAPNQRVWFVDSYTYHHVYTHYQRRWHKFSHGGTLKNLIQKLQKYILRGERLSRGHFVFPDWLCEGDLWGYGAEAMKPVIEAAEALGIIYTEEQIKKFQAPSVPRNHTFKNTNIKSCLQRLESLSFTARVSVCNVVRAIKAEEAYTMLCDNLTETEKEEVIQSILDFFRFVAQQDTDKEFANRWDIGATAYLLLLVEIAPVPQVREGLHIVSNIHNMWWLNRVASSIMEAASGLLFNTLD